MQKTIKAAKGFLIGVGFIGFALSIMTEPHIDVQKQLAEHGINPEVFAALFVLAGVAAFIYGLNGWNWNGLIFAPYYAFIGFALEAVAINPALSGSTATAYLLLGGLLGLDYAIDNNWLKGFFYFGRVN